MEHWSWLLLLLIVILLSSCRHFFSSTPTTHAPLKPPVILTTYRPITITPAYTLVPFSVPMTELSGTPHEGIKRPGELAGTSDLFVSPPQCYGIEGSGFLSCLGVIENQGNQSWGALRLVVKEGDGRERLIRVEQLRLDAYGRAPYRVIMPQGKRLTVELASAERLAETTFEYELEIQQMEWLDDGRYRIHYQLEYEARAVQLVAMLFDDQGELLSYRVQEFPAGMAMPLTASIDLLSLHYDAVPVSYHVAIYPF